jgi:hypothetical protein
MLFNKFVNTIKSGASKVGRFYFKHKPFVDSVMKFAENQDLQSGLGAIRIGYSEFKRNENDKLPAPPALD